MRDIAKELEISTSTVSLALRNDPRISYNRRMMIEKTAEKMGYQADPTLSALVSYRYPKNTKVPTHTIAVVVDHPDSEFYQKSEINNQRLEGAKKRSHKLGYKLELFWLKRDYKHSESLNNVLKARGIKGLILNSFFFRESQLNFDWDDYSVVKINRFPEKLKFDTVQSDQMTGVRLAISNLRKKGFKRIGLTTHAVDEFRNGNLLTSGYFFEHHSNNYSSEIIPPLIFDDLELQKTKDEVVAWATRNHLDAIVSNWNCFGNAAQVVQQQTGKTCVFLPLCIESHTRAFGGVDQQHDKIGEIAVELLFNKLKKFETGITETPTNHLVQPKWVEPPWMQSVAC